MKVKMYAADMGGCGHYRIIWPGAAAATAGLDVEVFTEEDGLTAKLELVCIDHPVTKERLVVDVLPQDADVIVLQRPLVKQLVMAIPFIQARGTAVVVECDDDFHAIHPHNIAYTTSDPAANPALNRDWLMRACEYADLVTVSTPALAQRYGKHGRVLVLPNYLPEQAYEANSPHIDRSRRWVGWSGTVATHPDDLQVTMGAVGRAIEQTGSGFYVVGPERGPRERLCVHDDTPYVATGWQPLDDYYNALCAMDVGIVPLADTPFNRAKSWLKGLEMAAVGVPFIASPLPEYQALQTLGAGMLATKTRQWEGMLKALLRDAGMRAEVAHAGREAAEHLRLSTHAHAWADAYLTARANFANRRHAVEYGMPELSLRERITL